MSFFDQYDRFYTTSQTSPFPHRLNGRHEAIIANNANLIAGKRVLDIASHDGRWSFAALQAGASHVTGIEPRQELIDNACDTFAHYQVNASRFDFQRGDVFNLLPGQVFDLVLCLGFYYHTTRHAELLDLIERTGAQFVIIDTEVTPRAEDATVLHSGDNRLVFNNPYTVQLLSEQVDDQQMAWQDALTRNGRTLVGRPSRAAVEFMATHFGYKCRIYDWQSHFSARPERIHSMEDYYQGWRDTFLLEK